MAQLKSTEVYPPLAKLFYWLYSNGENGAVSSNALNFYCCNWHITDRTSAILVSIDILAEFIFEKREAQRSN